MHDQPLEPNYQTEDATIRKKKFNPRFQRQSPMP